MSPSTPSPYLVRRESRSQFIALRGLRYHVRHWGDASMATKQRPPLLMWHGWMDVGASFQFVVDAMAHDRWVIAPDWRGFGLSESPQAQSYWFPDYLADIDALLDTLLPDQQIDLLGHSMGANATMLYAGVRPERIRRLVNLEGFGMPDAKPEQQPARYARWMDELKNPDPLRRYDSLAAVAERLRKTNPLLPADRAAWLAGHWSRQAEDGLFDILGDAAHKISNPVLYRADEVLACWKRIAAPVLWVEGDRTELAKWWGDRYSRDEFYARLSVVPQAERHVLSPAGHMLHHDQPQALAERLEAFLDH
ncbi:MAG: alpha/beta hydrolase [Rhizobacter sp.]|nr:alpha/beta hydrolase [Rhizobacter sp.]